MAEKKEPGIVVTGIPGAPPLEVDGPLVQEVLGLVRDLRAAIRSGVLLYGPRGTEIRRADNG